MPVDVGVFDDEIVARLHERTVSQHFLIYMGGTMVRIENNQGSLATDGIADLRNELRVDARSGQIAEPRVLRGIRHLLDIDRDDPAVTNLVEDRRDEECTATKLGTGFHYHFWTRADYQFLIHPQIKWTFCQ